MRSFAGRWGTERPRAAPLGTGTAGLVPHDPGQACLSRQRMMQLFPDARIYVERRCALEKSCAAYRLWTEHRSVSGWQYRAEFAGEWGRSEAE